MYIYYTIATIDDPPMNKISCKGRDVTINCGYGDFVFPVTWIINGTSFNQSDIMNNPSYQQHNLNRPSRYSLEVYSITSTTTFQCIIHSDPAVTSTKGIITVIGMWVIICSVTYRMCVHTTYVKIYVPNYMYNRRKRSYMYVKFAMYSSLDNNLAKTPLVYKSEAK